MKAPLLALAVCAAVPAAAQTQLPDRVRINGYSSFEFENMFGDEGRGDPNGSFDADLIDIVLNVTPHDRLRVATDLSWEHGAATEDGRGNVVVEYAFAEYFGSDLFKVRAGKMFTHFGIYNEIHTAKPAFLTVKEPLATNKNEKFGSELRFYPRWGNGVAVLGNGHAGRLDFDYVLQFTNGEQPNSNPFEEDDNGAKAVGGRLQVFPRQGLMVGGSFYTDALSEFDDEGELTGSRSRLLSYGGHAAWTASALGLEFEYVRGFIDPSFGARTTRHGLTALVSYRIHDRFTPYFRYEWLDPDTDSDEDTARLYIYGVNVRVVPGLYVKAELDTVSSGTANTYFEGVNYTEFKAAVAVGF